MDSPTFAPASSNARGKIFPHKSAARPWGVIVCRWDGKAVGRQIAARLDGVKDKRERIQALAEILRELGYESGSIDPANERWPANEATNCIFHNLAKCYPEVCHFDLAMMSEVVGCDVVHDECMVRGGQGLSIQIQRTPIGSSLSRQFAHGG